MTWKHINKPVSRKKFIVKRIKKMEDSIQSIVSIYDGTFDFCLLVNFSIER